MKLTSRVATAAVISLLASCGLGAATASAGTTPVWAVGKEFATKHILKTGESRETILAGGAVAVKLFYEESDWEVECKKTSGTGSVIGGTPGKGTVNVKFSECVTVWPNNCKLSLTKLEKIPTTLQVLEEGSKPTTETLELTRKNNKLIKIEEIGGRNGCVLMEDGEYPIYNNLPGLVGAGESLEFPLAILSSEHLLEWNGGPVLKFKDTFTQKLTNGEKLFLTYA
jgi:hypothetical protein